MDLAIVVVGDEILQGRRTEANAAFFAKQAFGLGLPLTEVRVVCDADGALCLALQQLARPGRWILTSGGLGPTRDDRTRLEIAAWLGEPLEERAEARALVETAYAQRGRQPDVSSAAQWMFPRGTHPIPNPTGTAPGIRAEREGAVIVCLPGVPSELQAMWTATLEPELRLLADPPGRARLFTHGLPESEQESRMRDLALEGVEFCSLPAPGGVEIQCLVREGTEREARALQACQEVAGRLAPHVVMPLGANLREALVEGLRRRDWQVGFAESCTAGFACATLADLAGVSDVLLGGVVAYANAIKTSQLGVEPAILEEHGAVSPETALAMAKGVRKALGVELGLSVTGIAGPGGGSAAKPVGLVWLGVSSPLGDRVVELRLVGSREQIRLRAAWRLLGLGWEAVRD